MKMPRKKIWAVLLCALCAAALTLPAWAAPKTAARTVNAENEDLFYGYLLQRAGASERVRLMADAGSKLNAKDKELYDLLKVWAAKVAAGEETSAVYRIVYDDFPLIWTKEELGVSEVFQVEGYSRSLTAECITAVVGKIWERLNYDLDAVRDALLADCPYELYWFDKTAPSPIEIALKNGESIQCQPFDDAGEVKVKLSEVPVCDVTVAVCADYAGEDSATVNRALHDGLDSVVTKAKSIVSAYADKSDYEKLLGYSTEICALVRYDDAAADDETNTPYGDPWQLISVFDGDANTNVVCEGYAKAFKYLCDLSAFSASNVECYLVTGALIGGKGAGEHMWNVVTMDDGKNYLVDLTNSDSNGGPDYLLLKGGSPSVQNPGQYTFYDWITFVYDDNTIRLWGEEVLTLNAADYPKPSSAPLRSGGYAFSALGQEVGMAHVRDGAKIVVTQDDSETDANVTLFLVVYNSDGRMKDMQQWELDFSQSFAVVQTQAVPDAASAKLIIVSENLTPLAASATLK